MSVFRRIALIGKLRSAETESSLQQLREFLRKRGCEVLDEGDTRADLAIVVGGDGTMLTAARNLVRHHVSDRGRRELTQTARQSPRADGFAGLEIGVHDQPEDFSRAIRKLAQHRPMLGEVARQMLHRSPQNLVRNLGIGG